MRSVKENLTKYFNRLSNHEVYFFYIVVLVNLLPVLSTKYFPTVDGPAHIYNSRLIIDLLTNNNSALADYFVFNSNLNPNWSDHFILGGLLYVFPAYLAEKILLLSYLILLPVSFRFLFNTLEIKSKYLLYFIFPFTYSFMFYYGFYNFHIGLVFFFLTTAYWVRFLRSGFNLKRLSILAALSLCVFFSHLFILGMLLIVVTVLNLTDIITLFKIKSKNKSLIVKSLSLQLLVVSPVLILSLFYFFSNPIAESTFQYIDFNYLWQMILNAQPAKGISYGKEGIFTKWIFILFSLITASLLFNRFKSPQSPITKTTINWGILVLITLVGLFTLPNGTSTFGFISFRLVLFFFLFFIVFLATQKAPTWIKVLSFVFINYVNFALVKIYTQSSQKMKIVSENIITAAEKIIPYSTVLPINDSDYWIFDHISNYLGADKPMVIFENYEASQNYFPLKWKQNVTTQFNFKEEVNNHGKVDYVFIFTNTLASQIGKNEKRIIFSLESDYNLIYLSEDRSIKLFKKKNN